jgi:hypothetical protein
MCGIFGSVGFTDGFTTGLMTLAGAIELTGVASGSTTVVLLELVYALQV